MQTTFAEYESARIFYRTLGTGPCVILLHGFGEDGSIWQNQWEHLKGHRIIIPDLPGSGRSDAVPDMSLEGLARAINQVLEKESVDKCTLIGHSMGGYTGLAFLELFPDKLEALGLFHSSAFADSEEKKEVRKKGIAFIEEHGGGLFLQTTIPNLYAPETREKNPALIKAHIDTMQDANGAALCAYYRSMMERPDRTDLLQQNKIPFLFVLGKYDTAVPAADGLKQAHLPQLAQVSILQRSGHMGMVEEPEQSNKLLQEFLGLAAQT